MVNGLDDFTKISRFADDNGDANYPIVRQKLIDIALRMDLIEPQRHLDQLIAWSLSNGDKQHYSIVPFTPLDQPPPEIDNDVVSGMSSALLSILI